MTDLRVYFRDEIANIILAVARAMAETCPNYDYKRGAMAALCAVAQAFGVKGIDV